MSAWPDGGLRRRLDASVLLCRYSRDERERKMNVEKAQIIAILRARNLDQRADWIARQFPEVIDTQTNGSLLKMLGIDPAELAFTRKT